MADMSRVLKRGVPQSSLIRARSFRRRLQDNTVLTPTKTETAMRTTRAAVSGVTGRDDTAGILAMRVTPG
jgi:hypothetical protein